MHFGENQLSRSLIGLSPLTTGHPPDFQLWWVRASTRSYPRFTLPMARSLRFGSRACYSNRPVRTRFRYGSPSQVNLATHRKLAGSFFKRHAVTTHQGKPRCATLPRLVGTRFQVLFHSAPAVLFTIPSRYYPLSVTREYLGLTGGPARFTQDFSGPVLLGKHTREPSQFRLRGSYPLRRAFRMPFDYHNGLSLPGRPAERPMHTPTTPPAQPLPGITHKRFSLIRFRSPLLPESLLFSLPAGTEMFHFPAFPPHRLYIQRQVTAHNDCRVSPFGNPRITARLTTPRGLSRPPTSFIGSWYQGIHRAPLKTWPQMLASTVKFSTNKRRHTTRKSSHALRHPTACPAPPATPHTVPHPQQGAVLDRAKPPAPPNSQCSTHEQPPRDTRPGTGHMLLRKEVIQPHLPVRLPCYDFVPIASPTFDSSLPQGVRPPASGVTDFRDVTGGVYKARERIHRSNADLRLLATPTSWGRVADPNPN